MAESTSIRVKPDTWRDLHDRKRLGQTMDDVVTELLEAQSDE